MIRGLDTGFHILEAVLQFVLESPVEGIFRNTEGAGNGLLCVPVRRHDHHGVALGIGGDEPRPVRRFFLRLFLLN